MKQALFVKGRLTEDGRPELLRRDLEGNEELLQSREQILYYSDGRHRYLVLGTGFKDIIPYSLIGRALRIEDVS